MTHLPPPYSPPAVDGGFDGPLPFAPPEALRAARQASIVLFVLAGLALAGGTLFLVFSTIPLQDLPPQTRDQLQELVEQTGRSVPANEIMSGLTMAIPGLIMAVLGFFVRGGRLRAIVAAMVCDGLLLVVTTVAILASVFNTAGMGPVGACPFIGAAAVMILLMVRLSHAAKAAIAAKSVMAQYYMQFMQFQQMQGTEGGGYGALPGAQEGEKERKREGGA
jgi:hypothetical protein